VTAANEGSGERKTTEERRTEAQPESAVSPGNVTGVTHVPIYSEISGKNPCEYRQKTTKKTLSTWIYRYYQKQRRFFPNNQALFRGAFFGRASGKVDASEPGDRATPCSHARMIFWKNPFDYFDAALSARRR
jgi:hypothetical protein